MKIPHLEKKSELKSCHNITWKDNYSWIHQSNILEVLRDSSKLLPEIRKYLENENDLIKKPKIKLEGKDKKEFLVIELKKGRASDVVMGQIQRYMGHIKNKLAGDKKVSGLIVALEDDKNLKDALSVAPNIKFMKYEVSFRLVE